MGKARWLLPFGMIGFALVASAGRASANIESTNGCNGAGEWEDDGLQVDAASIGDQVVEIPRSDTVDWQGSVSAAPGAYEGAIGLDLPPPFGEVGIDDWSGDTDSTSNAGVRDYDIPSFVPAGVEFKVVGHHNDENGTCTGYVRLEIEGGPFDSPAAPISLVATAAAGAGLVGTLRPLFRKAVV
ncbi:MAG TPA: hypothetical protein VH761_16545 [Ilumatobacteraceae bacterium]|jgi:hypothetical protein